MYSHTLLFRILPGTRNITLFSQTVLFEYCLARGTSPYLVKLYCLSIAWQENITLYSQTVLFSLKSSQCRVLKHVTTVTVTRCPAFLV